MKAEDREVRRYVEQKSAHIVSLVALWKQEERPSPAESAGLLCSAVAIGAKPESLGRIKNKLQPRLRSAGGGLPDSRSGTQQRSPRHWIAD